MSPEQSRPPAPNRRSTALERRLAVPVLVAAVVSVPALFLGVWGEGIWATAGDRINWAAGIVLWAEWIMLIALADNKREWLRTHWWATVVAAVTVPAVLLALGPAQVLRLVRVFGTLPLLRVTRIIEAGGVLRRRMGLTGRLGRMVAATTTLLAAVFVTAVLADPASAGRGYAEEAIALLEPWPTALAVGLTAAATAVVLAYRWRRVRAARARTGPPSPAQSSP
ncbi:metal-sensitive transcriptional repressor family protein [Nocardiopsis sp. YSL2]|uniref:metal-sensitive transcriptional repressor family protein n=1 Tax=Nocardiopsis sp. YSL2 TaxID=2939492 RepID=UPI0026F43E7F|nr:metal-sensitive transcriptional repressor family protein [Nocardiopsis sp. YSL2]